MIPTEDFTGMACKDIDEDYESDDLDDPSLLVLG